MSSDEKHDPNVMMDVEIPEAPPFSCSSCSCLLQSRVKGTFLFCPLLKICDECMEHPRASMSNVLGLLCTEYSVSKEDRNKNVIKCLKTLVHTLECAFSTASYATEPQIKTTGVAGDGHPTSGRTTQTDLFTTFLRLAL
jgi:hypothetical protein